MKTKFKYLIGIFLIAFIINVFGFTKNVYAEEASYKEFTKNAINASNEMDLYTSVMLAQYFLESGAKVEGDSITLSKLGASPYHNLFGIKGEYEGQSVSMPTLEDDGNGNYYEIVDKFRKYPSHKESFMDNAKLLKEQPGKNPRVPNELKGDETHLYSCTWKEYAKSYKDATLCLTGSYATDTSYNTKLNSIIESRKLTEFDGQSSTDDSDKKETTNDTVEQSKFVGEDAWKNKMINFQNQVYKSTFKGIDTGSTGFINSAFISGLNKTSQKVLNFAYIGMMIITIGLFLFMFLATIIYLVILPNGIGGYKLMDIFEKTTGLSASHSKQTTLDLISRLLLTTLVIACLYANVLPAIISSFISVIQYIISLF